MWGVAELSLRILGAKGKSFQRAEEFSFRDLGRSMHYFQGSREHRPPPGGLTFIRESEVCPFVNSQSEVLSTLCTLKVCMHAYQTD